jgi:hypothetical protein
MQAGKTPARLRLRETRFWSRAIGVVAGGECRKRERRKACVPRKRARGRVADEMRDYRASLSAIRGYWLDNAPFGAPLPLLLPGANLKELASFLGLVWANLGRIGVARMILFSPLSAWGRA